MHDEQNWRLRRFRNRPCHPTDPNWETGSYILCHPDFRGETELPLMIFDVVYLDAKRGIIRSAFPITKDNGLSGTDRVLYFEKFWFIGPSAQELVKLLDKPYSTPRPTGLGEAEVNSLIGKMQEAGYREYISGDKPSGVDAEDWKAMTQAARNALGEGEKIVGLLVKGMKGKQEAQERASSLVFVRSILVAVLETKMTAKID